ncbi:MAG TPA: AarF/UbiB family protein [Candidatus Acidoferrales bacterium]|jgi:ubiquinone biosynthesis protein|nr:AarF/UbiB family protein [Candidatus Acidoferrales bacterium]
MKLSLKPHHLKRYKDIAMLFWKYGTSDLAKEFANEGPSGDNTPFVTRPGQPAPEELADDLEKMGPTFIKFGQLLSSRPDLLPEPYLKALARLQDKVKPFPYAEVEQIVASELGVRLSKAFSYFEEKHLAAASLGQVHRAALRDGRPVVVKVQRPDIRKQITEDFEVLEEIADFFDNHTDIGRRYRFGKILAEFKTSILQELDYQREASNLTTLAANLKEFPHLLVPLPVPDYSSRCVLTMDYVSGTKITALSPIARLDLNGDALAEELFEAYLKQVLVDGFFHADPHPGNVFLTDDGRVALLDLGMTGRLSSTMQENLLRLLLAISEGNGDETVKIILRISEIEEDFDEAEFTQKAAAFVSEQRDQTLNHQDVGKALMEVSRTAAQTGLHVPAELILLGKTLLQLEEVGKILSPKFNPNASVRRNVAEIMSIRMHKAATPGHLFSSFLEMKDFATGLPGRVNKILDVVGNSELEVNVKTPDARHLLNGFEKIANRVTTGIILAALIVGAALMMRINSTFQIFGYPGIAMICFLTAIGGSGWLVLGILWKDYKDGRKPKK